MYKYTRIHDRDSELVLFVVCSFKVMTDVSLEGMKTKLKENEGERELFEVMI